MIIILQCDHLSATQKHTLLVSFKETQIWKSDSHNKLQKSCHKVSLCITFQSTGI